MRRLLFVLVIGCLAPDVSLPSPPDGVPPGFKPPHIVLAPQESLAPETIESAYQWSEGTGLNVRVAPEGIPVVLKDEVFVGDIQACGRASFDFGPKSDGTMVWTATRIEISSRQSYESPEGTRYCRSRLNTVMHEIGHAVCTQGLEQEAIDCHSSSGLMEASSNYIEEVDEPSLTVVCSAQECPAFNL